MYEIRQIDRHQCQKACMCVRYVYSESPPSFPRTPMSYGMHACIVLYGCTYASTPISQHKLKHAHSSGLASEHEHGTHLRPSAAPKVAPSQLPASTHSVGEYIGACLRTSWLAGYVRTYRWIQTDVHAVHTGGYVPPGGYCMTGRGWGASAG